MTMNNYIQQLDAVLSPSDRQLLETALGIRCMLRGLDQLFSSKFSTCSITLRNTSGLYCGGYPFLIRHTLISNFS